MNNMKTSMALLAIAFALPAAGQNLNPTVEVQNAYLGKLIEAGKPRLEMSVPDSLMKFDLDFDYSVNETPYKGGYEFNPYMVDLKPEAAAVRKSSLYLRAGAGYVLRPEVDFLYDPALNGPLSLDIYARHRSYFGKYDYGNGYDAKTVGGVAGKYLAKSGVMNFNAGYFGMHNKYDLAIEGEQITDETLKVKTGLNAIDLGLGYKSKGAKINYNAAAALRAGKESDMSLYELSFNGGFSPSISKYGRLSLDFEGTYDMYEKETSHRAGTIYVIPSVSGVYKGLSYFLGVRMGTAFYGKESELVGSKRGQGIYPEVHVAYTLVKNYVNLYADVEGSGDVTSYTALREWNPFCSLSIDNADEKLSARIGLRGNIIAPLKFDISGGWRAVDNGYFDALSVLPFSAVQDPIQLSDMPLNTLIVPLLGRTDYKETFATVKLAWDRKPLLVEGELNYRSLDMEPYFGYIYEPSRISGSFRMKYNYVDRFFAGVSAGFASKQETGLADHDLPSYVDLALDGEYVMTPKFSVWAKFGNILGQKIARHPLFAERGVSLIGGITLNL